MAISTGMEAFPTQASASVGPAQDLVMVPKPTQTVVKHYRNRGIGPGGADASSDDDDAEDEEEAKRAKEAKEKAAADKSIPQNIVRRQDAIINMSCRLCKEVLKEAHSLHPCGHLFCKSCAEGDGVTVTKRGENGIGIEREYRCTRCKQISLDPPMPVPSMDIAIAALKEKGFFVRMG